MLVIYCYCHILVFHIMQSILKYTNGTKQIEHLRILSIITYLYYMEKTQNRQSRNTSQQRRRRTYSSHSHSDSSQSTKFQRGRNRGRSSYGKSNNRRGRGGNSRNNRRRNMPSFNPSEFINKNPVEIQEETYIPKHKFTDFGLNGRLSKTINRIGLETPSPIQDQIIPEILNGRDVIGLAETGTGKTAAFLVPLIENTLKEYSQQTLILAPTRELAIQIENEFKKLTSDFKLYSTVCVGGTNIRPQINSLRKKNHFVIATPGRILDLINRGNFDTTKVTTVVLDEADRMLDMGFIHDIRAILENTPKDRQTLFFSATMGRDAEKIVNDFLTNPVTVSVRKKDVTNSIAQDVVPFEHAKKYETLLSLLEDPSLKRVIIFGSMKHSVEKLAKELCRSGIRAESIHGNKNHGQRQRSLSKFKNGNVRVLVATDVAARGIHVDNVTHVINYDLPNTKDDYVHRIGRTGRGVEKGMALTFVPKY